VPGDVLAQATADLDRLRRADPGSMTETQSPEAATFWQRRRDRYGDDGLRQIVAATEALPCYAGNTVIVVTPPGCGRDANPLPGVPFRHPFSTASARKARALVTGPRHRPGQDP
jgi:hypothetical protein